MGGVCGMVNVGYRDCDYGKFEVYSSDGGFCFTVYTETHAITLCEVLKELYGKIEYQGRVIDKCIRNERLYESMISDRDEMVSVLNKEKRILKKIVREKDGELDKYRRICGVD